MNIIVCGLPGSGKTTVGKYLADFLSLQFIDTDHLIEEAQGMSCRELFLTEGEENFRSVESEVIAKLKDTIFSVISVGGGSLIKEGNARLLKELGTLIYLEANPEILYKRLLAKGRIFDSEISFKELMLDREKNLNKWADKTINIDGLTIERICQKIHSEMSLELQPGESLMERQLALLSTDAQPE